MKKTTSKTRKEQAAELVSPKARNKEIDKNKQFFFY